MKNGLTADDIHKTKEYHYEYTKNMTAEERTAFYKEGIELRRTQKTALKK